MNTARIILYGKSHRASLYTYTLNSRLTLKDSVVQHKQMCTLMRLCMCALCNPFVMQQPLCIYSFQVGSKRQNTLYIALRVWHAHLILYIMHDFQAKLCLFSID
jgi:hypothetical protein